MSIYKKVALPQLLTASELCGALQMKLRRRQEDLLQLEVEINQMLTDRSAERVIIDQAEDIRRAIRTHVDADVPEISRTLAKAEVVLRLEVLSSDVTRRIVLLLDVAAVQARRAATDLTAADRALRWTAQAIPGEFGLVTTSRASVDVAASRLDRARGVVFRLKHHLSTIIVVLGQTAHSAPDVEGIRQTDIFVARNTIIGSPPDVRRLRQHDDPHGSDVGPRR